MPLSVGDRLGPYVVTAPIGTGGTGEVYKAVYKANDTRLDRSVALKVLPERIAKREDLRARFEREDLIGSSFEGQMITLRTAGTLPGLSSSPSLRSRSSESPGLEVSPASTENAFSLRCVKQSAPLSFDVVLNWQALLQK